MGGAGRRCGIYTKHSQITIIMTHVHKEYAYNDV